MKTCSSLFKLLGLLVVVLSHSETYAAVDCRALLASGADVFAQGKTSPYVSSPQADLSQVITKEWYRDLVKLQKKSGTSTGLQPKLLWHLFNSDPALKIAALSFGFRFEGDMVIPPDPITLLKKTSALTEIDTPLKAAVILDPVSKKSPSERLFITNIYELPANFEVRQWTAGTGQYSNREYFTMVDQGFFPVDTKIGHFYEHDDLHIVDFYALKGGKSYAKALRTFAKFALSLTDDVLDGQGWFRGRSLYVGELMILPDLSRRKDIEGLFGKANQKTSIEQEKAELMSLSVENLTTYAHSVLVNTPSLLERHGGAALDSFHVYQNQKIADIENVIEEFENGQGRSRATAAQETLLGILREIYFSARQLKMVPTIDNAYYLAVDFDRSTGTEFIHDLSSPTIEISAEKIRSFLIDRLARLKSAMRVGLAVNITADKVVREASQVVVPSNSSTYQFYNSYGYKFPRLQAAFLNSPGD